LRLESGVTVSARSDLLSAPRTGGVDGLYRAVLAGSEAVIDATAGLGADAFHLAARGGRVTLVERSPIVVALLVDALARARAGTLGANAAAAARLLDLVEGDAITVLGSLSAGVIVLDPLFPVRTKSAATNKGMEALRALTGEEPSDQFALLEAARRSATRRVVVKRGIRDAPLAGVPPSGALAGRSVRFDLYAPSS